MGKPNCTQTCPEVFQLEEGKSKVIVDTVYKEAEVKCREVEARCSVQAIFVTE
ncbi:ferredoxin [Petrotoga mobilis]|uniref:ferredoxin n=1 Tax=Petrotoga mobilis TaxID=69499 RepID=UPI00030DC850|nr:ferredoxin [Petrotoga mobilis]